MTSDQFFLQNDKNYDLVFLDGLHTYEQTIKDIKRGLKIRGIHRIFGKPYGGRPFVCDLLN